MAISYDGVIEALMAHDVGGGRMSEGLAHSFPIMGKEDGVVVDCYFLYSLSSDRTRFNAPIARLAIDPAARRLVYCFESDVWPFGTDGAPRSYALDFSHSKDERRVALPVYRGTYARVREFVYGEGLDGNRPELLDTYMKSLWTLVADNQKQFYTALSPTFFEWAASALKK
jgi:hypothetical protein